jgi:hypothetical protein
MHGVVVFHEQVLTKEIIGAAIEVIEFWDRGC